MIFGFAKTSKRGKGDSCKKKAIGFTLMLTQDTRVSSKTTTQVEDDRPLFGTCRSEYVKSVAIENATAVNFFKPEETPTQFSIERRSREEDHASGSADEKISEN
jgi:hypothetical protein